MRIIASTLLVGSFILQNVSAAVTPPIAITVKNYDALENSVVQVIDAAAPGMGEAFLAGFREEIGLGELDGVDRARPWQAAVWLESAGQSPSVSVRVPVSDFQAFKAGLANSPLADQAEGVRQVEDYAVLWLEQENTSAAVRDANNAWTPGNLQSVDAALEVAFQPGEPLRNELLGFVGLGRMMISGALGEQGTNVVQGVDTAALMEMMGLYFDVVDTGLRGLHRFSLALDVSGDDLVIDESVTAKPGSQLATWLEGTGASLEPILRYLDEDSQATLAMRFSDSGGVMPLLKRYMAASFKVMGTAADDPIVAETNQLIEDMIPMQFGGSFNFDEGIHLSGAYRFPGRDMQATYAKLKTYISESMSKQTGEGKPYKEIALKEGVRTINGTSIDELVMEINLDAPMYQQPGQKDMMNMLWSGGRIVFDYALKGDELLIGTPNTVDALLTTPPAAVTPRLEVTDRTVAYGRMNVLKLIPGFLAGNPMMPEEMKAAFDEVDSEGTDMVIRIDLNDGLFSRTLIPLKFIRNASELAGQGQSVDWTEETKEIE